MVRSQDKNRTKHQKRIREEEAWESQNTWESSSWALSSSTIGAPPSSCQAWAQLNSNCSRMQTLGSSVYPLSSSGSPGGQRACNVKQITTKGAAAEICQERERKYIVFIPWGLRASLPKPTNISPLGSSSACASNPFIPSNSINICACNTS